MPASRILGHALTLTAALLTVLAAALLVAGQAHTTSAASLTSVTSVTSARVSVVERPAALTSASTDDGTHTVSTVINPNPDPDWTSPTYTPPVCYREPVLLNTGTYSFGTSYAYDGNTYDRDNVFIRGGIYTWSDCLLASPHGGYMQLARLHPAWLPDDGTHDAAVITHPREVPRPIDTDDAGRTRWGSFLSRAD